MTKQPLRSDSDEAYRAAVSLLDLNIDEIKQNASQGPSIPCPSIPCPSRPGPSIPGPSRQKLIHLTATDVVVAVVGCEVPPPPPELDNHPYRILMDQNLVGCKTNLRQTTQLVMLGLSKKEINEVNGCGDLVDLIKNKLKAAKKRRCGKK